MHKIEKKKVLTIKEEQIIEEIEKIGEEISESIRRLFEYYSDEDNLPEEMKNAA